MSPISSDTDLWNDFRTGCKSSMEKIFRFHAPALMDYGYRFSSDRGLTQDCIQDLFVKLWSGRSTLGPTDNIRFYLMRSLRRMIVRSLKKEHKLGKRERIEEDFDFEIEFSHEFHLVQNQISLEKKNQLKQALDVLSKRQREAIYHKYYQELNNNEIAEVMGISIQAVYNLVSRSIDVLNQHLTEDKVLKC